MSNVNSGKPSVSVLRLGTFNSDSVEANVKRLKSDESASIRQEAIVI
jgi:hypothetical protein